MILADFEEFTSLQMLLSLSRWTGGRSQQEALEDYLHHRMWEAVRRLPHDEEILAEVLVEIVEIALEGFDVDTL